MNVKDTVCAVVVTYNRKELLIECLDALCKQTRPIQAMYIIDNFSTDGTPDALKEHCYISELPPSNLTKPWEKEFEIQNLTDGQLIRVHYVRMNENTGGAGGFYEGVKRGYEKGYDWLWLMDDDTIPDSIALFCLFEKKESLKDNNIGFLCSKVIWIDKTPHVMNIPSTKPFINGIPFNFFDDKGVLLVQYTSFVSLLIRREAVMKVGLPIKDFFIWGDDVEYTLRLTKRYIGLYVKDSIVVHKTKANYSSSAVIDWRYYFNIRNWFWIYRFHFRNKYVPYMLWKSVCEVIKHPKKFLVIFKAVVVSIIKTPKIEYPN